MLFVFCLHFLVYLSGRMFRKKRHNWLPWKGCRTRRNVSAKPLDSDLNKMDMDVLGKRFNERRKQEKLGCECKGLQCCKLCNHVYSQWLAFEMVSILAAIERDQFRCWTMNREIADEIRQIRMDVQENSGIVQYMKRNQFVFTPVVQQLQKPFDKKNATHYVQTNEGWKVYMNGTGVDSIV